MSTPVPTELLQGFLDAFNRHDLDDIMSYFEFADGRITRQDSFWKIVQ